MEQRLKLPKACPVCHVAMQTTWTESGVIHRCERCERCGLAITITPLQKKDENKEV